MKKLLLVCLSILLFACATKPKMKLDDVDRSVLPQQVVSDINNTKGKRILWGGTIVNSQNLKQGTRLEILAYPLNSNLKPNVLKKPLRRFIAEYPEYLETVDYAPGRLITITGKIREVWQGDIGQAKYEYPVVDVNEFYLWSLSQSDSNVHFGFGIMISN